MADVVLLTWQSELVEVLVEEDLLPTLRCLGCCRGSRPEYMPWNKDSPEILKTSVNLKQKKQKKMLNFLLT